MVKRILSILIATILLASGIQVSLDRHYCGGNLADVRMSFSGKLASCGMEESVNSCPNQTFLDKKCCEDQVTYFGISGNYYPEYFTLLQPTQERDDTFIIRYNLYSDNSFDSNLVNWVLPPGDNLNSSVTQSWICVFRI